MFYPRHLLTKPTAQEERQFERRNVIQKRERYLATNPLDRYEHDLAYREKVDRILAGLAGVRGRILDLGGNTAGEAMILVRDGFRVIVGDINEAALALSRERAIRFNLAAPDYVALDVHELPFKSDAFSAVTVVEALHHFSDYETALAEIHRVLRPGGLLLAFEPNARNPIRRLSEVRDRLRGSIEKSFSRRQLHALCAETGFQSVETRPMPIRRASWSIEGVPAYRRHFARFHGTLSEACPAWFGIWRLQARKAGTATEDDGPGDFRELLRSPGGRHEVTFDDRNRVWVQSPGGPMFPDLNGIPVLIRSDAVSRRLSDVTETGSVLQPTDPLDV